MVNAIAAIAVLAIPVLVLLGVALGCCSPLDGEEHLVRRPRRP